MQVQLFTLFLPAPQLLVFFSIGIDVVFLHLPCRGMRIEPETALRQPNPPATQSLHCVSLSRITFENIEQPADADSAVSPVSLHGSEAGTEVSTKEEAVHKTQVETEEEKGGCAKLDNGIVGEGESSSHYRHNRTFHLIMAPSLSIECVRNGQI